MLLYLAPLHTRAEGYDHGNCEDHTSLSKALDFDMVCRKKHWVYFLEVGLMQILANHETLFVVCHLFVHDGFFGPFGLHRLV